MNAATDHREQLRREDVALRRASRSVPHGTAFFLGRPGRPDRHGGYETWGYENFERSGRRPDREKLRKRGRGWFGARERVVARSAAGLKSPKMEVFLDFRSQKGPKADLIAWGVRTWGGTKCTPWPPKAAGKKQQ